MRAMLALALVGCGGSGGAADAGRPVVLQVKGSDTMVNLAQRLSEAFTAVDATVIVSVTGGGSGTGIKALIDGTTDLASSSREMKAAEIELAGKNNVTPVRHIVAYDGLSVYVHAENPIAEITFEQLKCIYSVDGTCNRWSDLGVTLDCGGTDNIVKLSRQNNSGTYEYFREVVLGSTGKFTNTLDQSGTQQVVDVVATSKCAIGYGGIGYHKDGARSACVKSDPATPCVVPSIETVKSGAYVLGRALQVYTNGEPEGAGKKFLDWVLSPAGQAVVVDAGFVDVKK